MKNSALRDLAGTLGAAAGLGLLLVKAPQAAAAARDGVQLCLTVVVPSLFPFLVMMRLVLRTGFSQILERAAGRFMEPLFHLPRQGASALVLGLLGGYPLGAAAAGELYREGKLQKAEAEQLLSFCSNAGPAFFFGMLGSLFGSIRTAGVLYGIHVLSALISGILLQAGKSARPLRVRVTQKKEKPREGIGAAVRTMGIICAYIVLFRVAAAICDSFLPQVPALRVGVLGLLELTGGCCALPGLEAAGLRYCLASLFLGFGGICVYMQTRAVLSASGLRGHHYLFGKAVQAVAAVLLTWAVMVVFPDLLPRELPAAYLPAHAGLLPSTAVVTASALGILGIWCIYLRIGTGKEDNNIV